jgi:hypothetical protein
MSCDGWRRDWRRRPSRVNRVQADGESEGGGVADDFVLEVFDDGAAVQVKEAGVTDACVRLSSQAAVVHLASVRAGC